MNRLFKVIFEPSYSWQTAKFKFFLNFGLRGFWRFAILRALSGDGRLGTMEHEEELDSLLSGDML